LRYLYEELTPGRTAKAIHGSGLDRPRALLSRLGDPQNAVKAVHVAGTAGKGSVCAFIASILTTHGFRVGAHLSPHAYCLRERFQIGGNPVGTGRLVTELDRVRPAIADVERAGFGRPTFFEVANAIAFGLFADEVDYSVIETGVGGLRDSTNTISRTDKLAVLTAIGLDHQDVLGETLSEIASQKAGILAEGGKAISIRNTPEVDAVLEQEAARRRCGLEFVDRAKADSSSTGPNTTLRLPGCGEMSLGLLGNHQATNARLAVAAVRALASRDGWTIDPAALRDGLERTSLPGRFERRIVDGRLVVLDGAHNALKLGSVVRVLGELHPGRTVPWVLALKQDKELDDVVRAIAPVAGLVVATEFTSEGGDHPVLDSRPAEEIAAAARAVGVPAVVESTPESALRCAAAMSDHEVPIVVSGSFHLLAALDRATRAK
jgi:dihydrofolate synthase/folylpolyglutamate synthase